MKPVDPDQLLQDYERDGVVIVREFFSSDEVAAVRAELASVGTGNLEGTLSPCSAFTPREPPAGVVPYPLAVGVSLGAALDL